MHETTLILHRKRVAASVLSVGQVVVGHGRFGRIEINKEQVGLGSSGCLANLKEDSNRASDGTEGNLQLSNACLHVRLVDFLETSRELNSS